MPTHFYIFLILVGINSYLVLLDKISSISQKKLFQGFWTRNKEDEVLQHFDLSDQKIFEIKKVFQKVRKIHLHELL